MKIAEAIGAAFGTFSRIPVPKSAWTDFGSTHALAAFPLVGLAEGFLMTAWGHVANLLGVPATIVAAVLVALPVAVTGGIHLDGLCDTSDALASWTPRERKLEIMHDPRAGAFGVIGVVMYLILQFSLFTALPLTAGAFLALLCSLVFSRALSGLAVECWPAARADGMAAGLSPAKKRAAIVVPLCAFAAASAAGMVACARAVGALMAVAGLLALAWYRHVALSRFGGVTGDLAGWFLQWAELAMLAMLVAGGYAPMILVVGGAHSGKRTFVREKLGFAADDFVDAAQLAEGGVPAAFAGRVAYHAEELVRALDADRALERLIGFDAVILSLVGSGVVPMHAEDAQWRERAGRLGCALAARADVVVRMTCGIPQVIKGNLADAPRGTQGAGAPLEVVFVRHGATAGTEDHRYSGAGTDEPLSSAGERALRDLACDRDVFRVITSGMARTDQTARILFPNAELMACPGLREMDFGDFEGRSAAELKEDVRYRAWVDSWCETRCPHGEGKSDFTRRVVAAFREACESERAQGSGRAVFVVHAGTVKALLSELAVPKMGYFDVHTEPGGAWAATWDGRCLRDVRPASGGDAR